MSTVAYCKPSEMVLSRKSYFLQVRPFCMAWAWVNCKAAVCSDVIPCWFSTQPFVVFSRSKSMTLLECKAPLLFEWVIALDNQGWNLEFGAKPDYIQLKVSGKHVGTLQVSGSACDLHRSHFASCVLQSSMKLSSFSSIWSRFRVSCAVALYPTGFRLWLGTFGVAFIHSGWILDWMIDLDAYRLRS